VRGATVGLVALLAAAPALGGGGSGARVLEHTGRWESGYGAQFYNVVGRLRNTSGHPLRWVKLRIDALDARGKVVASTQTYNESAEALAVPELSAADLLASGKVKPLAAGAEERFRGSFLKEETPPFTDYRVTVIDTPAAGPER
jgi:hypothetical protein